ncbi:MAG: helix-turn-helix transcriptional regulator [Nocardioides sp.]|nr:helix-turn-helix transcriptional regulator [Nocardioides sp.]
MGDMPMQLTVLESPAVSSVMCCAPLVAAPLSSEEATELAGRLKALADPTRLRLLSLMLANPGLEACTCDLTEPLGLTQPTVTHHLRKLTEAGLAVPDRKVGNYTYYRVLPEALAGLAAVLAPATA